jgi:hypothetical protein
MKLIRPSKRLAGTIRIIRQNMKIGPTLYAFEIPFELISLGCAKCARATNRGTTDSADGRNRGIALTTRAIPLDSRS